MYESVLNEIVALFYDTDRFYMLLEVAKASQTLHSKALADALAQELTVAEITLVSNMQSKPDFTEQDVALVAEYCCALMLMGVPVATVYSKLTPKQLEMYAESKPYLEVVNEFKARWKEANTP